MGKLEDTPQKFEKANEAGLVRISNYLKLKEAVEAIEEQLKCRDELKGKQQELSCVQQAVLTAFERTQAACGEDVIIGDVLPLKATRGMTNGASSSSDDEQECSPKDALFLLDVEFPGSYLEEITSCRGHEPTLVSSM